MTYDEWIAANYPDHDRAYGRCKPATDAMLQAFPELRQVRGTYLDAVWGERTHWWLVAPDGRVVDPTAAQFPTKGRGLYEELKPGDPVPSGVCMDCGDTVYDGATFCSDACERATARYLATGIL